MFSAILILLVMPFTDLSRSRGTQFKPLSKVAFFIFVCNFLILMELGAKHVESPFIEFGQISTVIYFAYFLIIVPLISLFENILTELSIKHSRGHFNDIPSPISQVIQVKSSPIYIQDMDEHTCPFPGPNSKLLITGKVDDRPGQNIVLPELNDDNGNRPNDTELKEPEAKSSGPNDKPDFKPDVKPNKRFNNDAITITLLTFILVSTFITVLLILLACVGLDWLPSHVGGQVMLHCDAPKPWGIYFQDSATPQMEALVELHDNILFYLIIILFAVGWLLISIVKNYSKKESALSHKHLSHGTLIELIWTITPALILILIAFPSFKLLYLMDEVSDPAMAVLAEGFFTGGLKLHILNKIKDTSLTGEKNNTLVPRLAQVESTSFLSTRYRKHNFTTFFTKPVCFNFKKTFHTKVKPSNRIGPHNEEVISVLIGSLLGDSYASARTIEGTRFSYKQSEVHKDYLFWLYEFYYKRGYCSNLKPRMYTRKLRNKISNEIKQHYGYEFNTFTFRSFNWIYKLFYKKGTKTLSVNLEQYLTPLALAIWIMDHGGWAKPGVRISSNSFKLQEVQLLANLLKKLFYLNCTVQKINTPGQYSIYIKGESVLKLRKLILPHVIPSMRYKLGL